MKTNINTTISSLKSWIFPSLVSIIGLMIWTDVSEIKADVKALMAQSNVDKTRIDNLERIVYNKQVSNPFGIPVTNVILEHVAILPNNRKKIKNKKNEEVLF